jgi:hypothetical protein
MSASESVSGYPMALWCLAYTNASDHVVVLFRYGFRAEGRFFAAHEQ